MATETFVVELGSGIFLDASGKLTFSAPQGALVYSPAHGFTYDAEKVAKTLKEFTELLPETKEAQEKLLKLGVDPAFAAALHKLGEISATVAGIATGLSILATLGELVGFFGESGLSPQMNIALTNIANRLLAIEKIQQVGRLLDIRALLDGKFNNFKSKFVELAVSQTDAGRQVAILNDMRKLVDDLSVALSTIQNESWLTSNIHDHYKSRTGLINVLAMVEPDSTFSPAGAAVGDVTRFDYRFGVPMILYAAGVLATMARVSMPWYRSTGVYAVYFRALAAGIDTFVLRMQDQCIARTRHTPATLLSHTLNPNALLFGSPMPFVAGGLGDIRYLVPPGTYPVGAFDLVRYSDGFLSEEWTKLFHAKEPQGKLLSMNYTWPAPDAPWEVIAELANEQADQDYADLLVRSGVFHLVSTGALLRHLSTPADRSETVQGASAVVRNFLGEEPALAESPRITPWGVVAHPATLKRYQARNLVHITTQLPGLTPAVPYRIVLRTIDSKIASYWADRHYAGDVWRTRYEPVVSDPACKRLHTELSRELILSDIAIHEGISPVPNVRLRGSVEMRAHSFDWYVPVLDNPLVKQDIDLDTGRKSTFTSGAGPKTSATAGAVSIHYLNDDAEPQPLELRAIRRAPFASLVDDFAGMDVFTYDEISLEKAERRHIREEAVAIEWELFWTAGRLNITLSGRPQDRNFQVFVVVEETIYSGEAFMNPEGQPQPMAGLTEELHTPVIAEIANQLLLVPRAFFEEEGKALASSSQLWTESVIRYSQARPVDAEDPVVNAMLEANRRIPLSRTTDHLAEVLGDRLRALESQDPDLFREKVRETPFPFEKGRRDI